MVYIAFDIQLGDKCNDIVQNKPNMEVRIIKVTYSVVRMSVGQTYFSYN